MIRCPIYPPTHRPNAPKRSSPPADSADFFGILVPVVRPDGIKPSILRFDKIFIADHGSNSTKKLEAAVPLIPFLKPQPWTNYKYKTAGTEAQGLYVDGGFQGNVADVTYAMAISRDHLGADYAEARGGVPAVRAELFQVARHAAISLHRHGQRDIGRLRARRFHGDLQPLPRRF